MSKLTWEDIKGDIFQQIELFEDPVYSSYVERDTFVEMYGEVLEELDGECSQYFTSYFEPSPVNKSIYIFVNNEMRNTFYKIALDIGVVLELKEIHEGESKEEKKLRQKQKPPLCPKVIAKKKSEQMLRSLESLSKRLDRETNEDKRLCIEAKINRILAQIDHTV